MPPEQIPLNFEKQPESAESGKPYKSHEEILAEIRARMNKRTEKKGGENFEYGDSDVMNEVAEIKRKKEEFRNKKRGPHRP